MAYFDEYYKILEYKCDTVVHRLAHRISKVSTFICCVADATIYMRISIEIAKKNGSFVTTE